MTFVAQRKNASVTRLVLIALALMPGWCRADSGDNSRQAGSDTVSVAVKTARAGMHDLSVRVLADGTVRADTGKARALSLGYDIRVGPVWVHEGDRVTKGQKLFRSLPTADTAAKFQEARATLSYARQELARQKRLRDQSLAGNNDVAQAQSALANARARFKALESAGEDHSVKAPFAGTVTRMGISPGAVLAANNTALVLVPNHRIVVLGVQPEDADRLKAGDAARVTDTFNAAHAFDGVVTQVGDAVDTGSGTVPVTVSLPVDAGHWRVNTPVKAVLTVKRETVLAVPRAAVLSDEQGSYVFVVRNGKGRRVAVSPGITDGDWTAVSGDLKRGDTVVTQGNYELQDGMAVRAAK